MERSRRVSAAHAALFRFARADNRPEPMDDRPDCGGLSQTALAEAAFRDLNDPGMLATHPQSHWTDQKLHVHAFMCVTGYRLVRLLWWRARREAGFTGSARYCPHNWRRFAAARWWNIPGGRDDRGSANKWKKSTRSLALASSAVGSFALELRARRIYGMLFQIADSKRSTCPLLLALIDSR